MLKRLIVLGVILFSVSYIRANEVPWKWASLNSTGDGWKTMSGKATVERTKEELKITLSHDNDPGAEDSVITAKVSGTELRDIKFHLRRSVIEIQAPYLGSYRTIKHPPQTMEGSAPAPMWVYEVISIVKTGSILVTREYSEGQVSK